MNKNRTHRVFCISMAMMLLFSSVGFSIDLHYCKGELKSFSLLGEATSCHTAKTFCPHHADVNIGEKKDCCENHKFEIDDLDEDFTFSPSVALKDFQIKFITSFIHTFSSIEIPVVNVQQSTFLENKNPLPPRDIYVLLESFLL